MRYKRDAAARAGLRADEPSVALLHELWVSGLEGLEGRRRRWWSAATVARLDGALARYLAFAAERGFDPAAGVVATFDHARTQRARGKRWTPSAAALRSGFTERLAHWWVGRQRRMGVSQPVRVPERRAAAETGADRALRAVRFDCAQIRKCLRQYERQGRPLSGDAVVENSVIVVSMLTRAVCGDDVAPARDVIEAVAESRELRDEIARRLGEVDVTTDEAQIRQVFGRLKRLDSPDAPRLGSPPSPGASSGRGRVAAATTTRPRARR